MLSRHLQSGGRYPVLRSLAIIYVFAAALAAVATVFGLGYIVFGARVGTATDKLIISVGAIIGGFVMVVSLLAVAEVLKLFIDIEHNTRAAAMAGRTVIAADTAVVTTDVAGNGANRMGSLHSPDEETAEAALIRGH